MPVWGDLNGKNRGEKISGWIFVQKFSRYFRDLSRQIQEKFCQWPRFYFGALSQFLLWILLVDWIAVVFFSFQNSLFKVVLITQKNFWSRQNFLHRLFSLFTHGIQNASSLKTLNQKSCLCHDVAALDLRPAKSAWPGFSISNVKHIAWRRECLLGFFFWKQNKAQIFRSWKSTSTSTDQSDKTFLLFLE